MSAKLYKYLIYRKIGKAEKNLKKNPTLLTSIKTIAPATDDASHITVIDAHPSAPIWMPPGTIGISPGWVPCVRVNSFIVQLAQGKTKKSIFEIYNSLSYQLLSLSMGL